MKSYQFAERAIRCGQASQYDTLIAASARETPGTIIDLRTFVEMADQQVPKAPEGWGYRRLPVTGATISEQDLDVFRREFFRKPQTVVIDPSGSRGQLLVAASLSRLEKGGWEGGRRAEADPAHGEQELQDWLTTYLVRHGYEDASALQGLSTKPSDPKPVQADTEPSFEVEPTVEMDAFAEADRSLAMEPTVEMESPLAAGSALSAEAQAEKAVAEKLSEETASNEMTSVDQQNPTSAPMETPGATTANRRNPPQNKTSGKESSRRKK